MVPQIELNMGNYTLVGDFYVVQLANTNVMLGVQWLISIGMHWNDYHTMEMEWFTLEGKCGCV